VPKLDHAQEIQVLDTATRAVDEVKRGIGAAITDEKYRQLVAYL